MDGPFLVDESDDVTNVATTGDRIPIHAIVPRAPGPFPVVVLAHGFQVPANQYFETGRRIATFGYVVLHPEYPTSLFGQPNHAAATLDMIAVLDWALAANASGAGPLGAKLDVARVAIGGHSLGAKLSVLAAAQDARFRAVFLLDPVDAVPTNCLPGNCPQARAALPLAIPTLVLGETLDATPGFFGSSCAPATDNFAAFFAKTSSPSLQVVIPGAAHMSFIDDTAACGVACFVCKGALIPQASVLEVTRSFTVAFLERHLKGTAAYDEHLTGATAQSRWVATGRATLTAR